MGRDQTKANMQVPGRNDVQQATVETAYRRNGAKSVYNNRCVEMPRELCFGGPHEGDAHHLLSVAMPQMWYACSTWFNAGWPDNGYTQKTLRKVQSL